MSNERMQINFIGDTRPNPLGLLKPANNFNSVTTTGGAVGRYYFALDPLSQPNAPRGKIMHVGLSDQTKRMLPCKNTPELYNNQRVKRRPPAKVQLYPPNPFSRDNTKGIAVESSQKLAPILPQPNNFYMFQNSQLGASD